MNHTAFAVAATLPALVLLPLNFEPMHGYYAYSLPVAGSTVGTYSIVYATVDDHKYHLDPVQSRNRIFVTEHVGSTYLPPF